MKIILAIINNDDAPIVSNQLTRAGINVTKMASTGGFLMRGNSTFISGVEDDQVDKAIEARKQVADYYRSALRTVKGVRVFDDVAGVRHNYSYFPILINAEEYGMTRDELYFKMKEQNVLGRRYFYPLISTFDTYKNLESSNPANLPEATRIADEVICLPMYYGLTDEDLERVVECIVK